jgi:D-sedoheptulose 7-phosphate isomerase
MMNGRNDEFLRGHLESSRRVLDEACGSEDFLASMSAIADAMCACLRAGNKILIAGNGGSAADAQHIAGELISRLAYDRAPLPAIALTTDTSVLTAIGNDYGFEEVFERQVRGLGRQSDVFIGISTSGKSANIIRALAEARQQSMVTIGLTGNALTTMHAHCDLSLRAPSTETPLIQQIHLTAIHAICGLVEATLFPRAPV